MLNIRSAKVDLDFSAAASFMHITFPNLVGQWTGSCVDMPPQPFVNKYNSQAKNLSGIHHAYFGTLKDLFLLELNRSIINSQFILKW